MNDEWIWSDWASIARIAAMGVLGYAALIAVLRVSGKRTLSKMNAFDFVITVTIGSTFAMVLLDTGVTLAEGATAFAVLVFLQFAVAWLSVRSASFESLVKSRPTVLVWRGRLLHDVMRRCRVTEAEILAACREQGLASLEPVDAVVLETAGEFSVVVTDRPFPPRAESTLRTVRVPPDATRDPTADPARA